MCFIQNYCQTGTLSLWLYTFPLKKNQKEDSYLQTDKLCKFVHDCQGKLKEKTS